MSGVLVIGETEQKSIAQALAKARASPVPWAELQAIAIASETNSLMLKERRPGNAELRRKYPTQNVRLGTYRAAISFEEQPHGLTRHPSVSSAKRGKVPGPEVMAMVVDAFGFSGWPPMQRPGRCWVEEFEPGHMAANVVELEEPTP